ncbi:hypothetical protein H2203_002503 [Taxawa tesnikishii (nom. ined.)]|nr:hypothetical protein H2203_002503 [Dothideales sp. JES 119]
MPYSYSVAKEVLSDNDKNRLLAIYLCSDNPMAGVDWDTASAAFGSASVGSMKVMTRAVLKKIADAGGKTDTAGNAAAAAAAAAPKTPKSKGGRKRKADPNTRDDDDDEEATPSKNSAKEGKKAAKAEKEDDDDDYVKTEVVEDEA